MHGGKGPPVPVASSPFAAAPPPQQGAHGTGLVHAGDSPTGPILGKDSELERVYYMPHNMGHESAVNCMCMVEGKVYTGGRDNFLCTWQGRPGPDGSFQLAEDTAPIDLGDSVTALLYEPTSRWLFCGLWGGGIQAYCRDPVISDRLEGHRRSITSLTIHSSVLISGSFDGTVRLWTPNPQAGRFQCFGQPLQSPSGPVSAVRVVNDGLWVGGAQGITCFDLGTLQAKGTIPSAHPVTGMLEFEGYMFVTFRNGDVKILDGAGGETYYHPSRGEHTSNTAVELMTHPVENKPMLLCGQQFGYITAYDLPDFRPRGSFVTKNQSDVKCIVDAKMGGMFLTGGVHGDVVVWRWRGLGAVPTASNPFAAPSAAASVPVASNPFAPAPAGGGMMG